MSTITPATDNMISQFEHLMPFDKPPTIKKLEGWDSVIIHDNYSDPKPETETTEILKNQATNISQLPLESKIKQAAKLILNPAFIAKLENEQLEILENCQLSDRELVYIFNNHPKLYGNDKSRNFQWFDMRELISEQLKKIRSGNRFRSLTPGYASEQTQDMAVNFAKKVVSFGILGKGGTYDAYTKYQESQPLPPDTVKDWN